MQSSKNISTNETNQVISSIFSDTSTSFFIYFLFFNLPTRNIEHKYIAWFDPSLERESLSFSNKCTYLCPLSRD